MFSLVFFLQYHFLTPNESHLHGYWQSSKRGTYINNIIQYNK
jgi:hypothetical protein